MKKLISSDCVHHSQNTSHGYAGVTRNGVKIRLHRLVYCEANGIDLEAIKGQSVRHKCDNPRCINPDHLELGSHTENMQDKRSRGRCFHPKGTLHGQSKLTEKDVIWIRSHLVKGSKTHGLRAIARMFGMAKSSISSVVDGRTWGHL